jgi:spore germination cell wall hydrolase CwlJ-like protein
MPGKVSYRRRASRFSSLWSRWWSDLRFYWHTKNKAPWIVAAVLATAIAAFGFLTYSMSSTASQRRELTCLAMNVYYEARGEPLAGLYAVAEVTMNRVASGRYPGTVCEVVYQKKWDPLRKRNVSAFSWTEFDVVPHPEGEKWQQAWEAARDVYQGRHSPTVNGALHYHATYIRPSWARGRKPVATIGAHVFYR